MCMLTNLKPQRKTDTVKRIFKARQKKNGILITGDTRLPYSLLCSFTKKYALKVILEAWRGGGGAQREFG